MKTVGIIAEYNPFHNGHEWQIKKIKEQFDTVPIVAIMSGHFTQRGEPAFLNKWSRASMAIHGGVDLVIELPFIYACKSAEFFAKGSINIFNKMQIITDLCFGTESNDFKILKDIATLLVEKEFDSKLKETLKKGHTYAKAIELLVNDKINTKNTLKNPNNILAIEYLKALLITKSAIKPYPIKRERSNYLDNKISSDIASATAIRNEIVKNNITDKVLSTLPIYSQKEIKKQYHSNNLLLNYNILEKILFYRLRTLTKENIRNIANVSEGLENRIKEGLFKTNNVGDLIDFIATKRYPKTRIQRILIELLVFTNNTTKNNQSTYLRVLAFNKKGRNLIKNISEKTSIPVISNLPKYYNNKDTDQLIKESLSADIMATDLFYILTGQNKSALDFTQKPIYIENI